MQPREVFLDLSVQQVMQLGGELDTGRAATCVTPSAANTRVERGHTDDAEVQELAPIIVCNRRLVRLLEACTRC